MTRITEEEVPRWVRKAQARWEEKLPSHPYDMTKTFKGRTFIYTCKFKTIEQGRVSEHWTRERRYPRSLWSQICRLFR